MASSTRECNFPGFKPYPCIQIFATNSAAAHKRMTAAKIRTSERNDGRPVDSDAGSAKTSSKSAPQAVKAIRASIVYSLA